MGYQHIQIPQSGEKITVNSDLSLNVPNNPIIPYIEGDGIGFDITPVMISVIDAAVKKAYAGDKQISWMEVFCGEKAAGKYDGDWFPAETLEAIKDNKFYILPHTSYDEMIEERYTRILSRTEPQEADIPEILKGTLLGKKGEW